VVYASGSRQFLRQGKLKLWHRHSGVFLLTAAMARIFGFLNYILSKLTLK